MCGVFNDCINQLHDNKVKSVSKVLGKNPKASSAHSPGRSVPGLMRQTLPGNPVAAILVSHLFRVLKCGSTLAYCLCMHLKNVTASLSD